MRDAEKRIARENQGIYMFQANALCEAMENLARNNIQGEEYLTDAVDSLSPTGRRVIAIATDDASDVLGLNDAVEFLEIEERLRRRAAPLVRVAEPPDRDALQPPAEWARRLRENEPCVRTTLRNAHGNNTGLCEEKRQRLLDTVELLINKFGTAGRVTVIRAPGRLNLMGRHVDHRGACVNLMAIALAVPGVSGAQPAGAGFGGCMIVLARAETARDVMQRMDESYYRPENLSPGAILVTPIAGCSALRVDGS